MELPEQIGMVLVVFALLGGLVWFTRKRGMISLAAQRGKTRQLEPLERMQLTPHHALHLVRISGKVVLIATAPSACTIVDTPISADLPSPAHRGLFSNDK